MYLILTYLILFFYDIEPIMLNGYVIKKENKDYCPLYFSIENNNETNCNLNWYTLNDSFNGHKIQCIGRSPYTIDCTFYYNEIDKCFLINSCLPENFTYLCEGINLI